MKRLILALMLAPCSAMGADIHFLGEQHDNPAHHERQASYVADLSPTAIVFEMLTAEQAARVTPELINDPDALEAALNWEDSGWPDFSMYYPIFAAVPDAAIFGAALPREEARRLMTEDVTAVFGDDASTFGLTDPLPEAQQSDREALQRAAHCNAMPDDMLGVMVTIQRLRDAYLARAALDALADHGAPVVVITGNGHARKDWGAPASVAYAAPDVTVFALGQGEEGGAGPGVAFDSVEITAGVDRGDPCDAFRSSD